jgi:hypothetical protein
VKTNIICGFLRAKTQLVVGLRRELRKGLWAAETRGICAFKRVLPGSRDPKKDASKPTEMAAARRQTGAVRGPERKPDYQNLM